MATQFFSRSPPMVDATNVVDDLFAPSAQTCCEQFLASQPPRTAKIIKNWHGRPRNESYRMAPAGLPQKLFGRLLFKKQFLFTRASSSWIWHPMNLIDRFAMYFSVFLFLSFLRANTGEVSMNL